MPTLDDLVEGEAGGFAALVAAVEHRAVDQFAFVVHLNRRSVGGQGTVAFAHGLVEQTGGKSDNALLLLVVLEIGEVGLAALVELIVALIVHHGLGRIGREGSATGDAVGHAFENERCVGIVCRLAATEGAVEHHNVGLDLCCDVGTGDDGTIAGNLSVGESAFECLSEGKVLRGVDALRLEQISLHVGHLGYTISIGEVRTRGGLAGREIRLHGSGRGLFLLGSFGGGSCAEREERQRRESEMTNFHNTNDKLNE